MQDWSWKTRFEVFPKKKSVPTLVQANYRRFSDNDNKMIDVNIKDDVNDNNDNNDNSNGTAPTMNNNNNTEKNIDTGNCDDVEGYNCAYISGFF